VGLALGRDIAIIWLALLCFIGMIVPLAVSIFAVKGMHAAVSRTPRLLRQVQGHTRKVRIQVDAASYHVAAPVIRVQRQSTRISTFLDRLLRRSASPFTGRERN
jgi:hypothetical protein